MSDRVAATLEFQGRSQRWLARQLGVHESYVSKVLKGERPMPEAWRSQIANALGLHPDVLFLDSSSKNLDASNKSLATVGN